MLSLIFFLKQLSVSLIFYPLSSNAFLFPSSTPFSSQNRKCIDTSSSDVIVTLFSQSIFPLIETQTESISKHRVVSMYRNVNLCRHFPLTLHRGSEGKGEGDEGGVKSPSQRTRDDDNDENQAQMHIHIRAASKNDMNEIRLILLSEKMNFLSGNWSNFIVAEKEKGSVCSDEKKGKKIKTEKEIVGFGQIRLLSSPSSSRGHLLEEEEENLYEISSLYVKPEERKCGIGSLLVNHLLEKVSHDNILLPYNEKKNKEGGESRTRVLLLTLQSTCSFYENLAFVDISKTSSTGESKQNFMSRIISFSSKQLKESNSIMIPTVADEDKVIPLSLKVEQLIGNIIAPEEVIIMERFLTT